MKAAFFRLAALLLVFAVLTPVLRAQSTPNSAVARTAAYNVSSQPATATEPPPVVNGPPREYVILTGGPSLTVWEKYKTAPHDQFWGSFRARLAHPLPATPEGERQRPERHLHVARLRGRLQVPVARRTTRTTSATSIPCATSTTCTWSRWTNGVQVMDYLNHGQDRGNRIKVVDFEYFGHSNRCCFMFDYSSNIDSASKNYLHEDQLTSAEPVGVLPPRVREKLGLPHGREHEQAKFYDATGTRMIGAIGRTDFTNRDEAFNGIIPVLSSPDGKWVQ